MRTSTGILLVGAALGGLWVLRAALAATREDPYQKPATPENSGRGAVASKRIYGQIHDFMSPLFGDGSLETPAAAAVPTEEITFDTAEPF